MDEKKMDINVTREVIIKNKKGVVVINRIHADRCVPIMGNNIQSNQDKRLLFSGVFLSSLVSDKKMEEKR